jgi:hypothetical protein
METGNRFLLTAEKFVTTSTTVFQQFRHSFLVSNVSKFFLEVQHTRGLSTVAYNTTDMIQPLRKSSRAAISIATRVIFFRCSRPDVSDLS